MIRPKDEAVSWLYLVRICKCRSAWIVLCRWVQLSSRLEAVSERSVGRPHGAARLRESCLRFPHVSPFSKSNTRAVATMGCSCQESLVVRFVQGEELVTGTAQGGDANYFRIHVNKYNTVEAITCFSTQVPQTSDVATERKQDCVKETTCRGHYTTHVFLLLPDFDTENRLSGIVVAGLSREQSDVFVRSAREILEQSAQETQVWHHQGSVQVRADCVLTVFVVMQLRVAALKLKSNDSIVRQNKVCVSLCLAAATSRRPGASPSSTTDSPISETRCGSCWSRGP